VKLVFPGRERCLAVSAWRAVKLSPSLDGVLHGLADSDALSEGRMAGWEETFVLTAAMARAPEAFLETPAEANLPLAGRTTGCGRLAPGCAKACSRPWGPAAAIRMLICVPASERVKGRRAPAAHAIRLVTSRCSPRSCVYESANIAPNFHSSPRRGWGRTAASCNRSPMVGAGPACYLIDQCLARFSSPQP
jgi:hypothetical protein